MNIQGKWTLSKATPNQSRNYKAQVKKEFLLTTSGKTSKKNSIFILLYLTSPTSMYHVGLKILNE